MDKEPEISLAKLKLTRVRLSSPLVAELCVGGHLGLAGPQLHHFLLQTLRRLTQQPVILRLLLLIHTVGIIQLHTHTHTHTHTREREDGRVT